MTKTIKAFKHYKKIWVGFDKALAKARIYAKEDNARVFVFELNGVQDDWTYSKDGVIPTDEFKVCSAGKHITVLADGTVTF